MLSRFLKQIIGISLAGTITLSASTSTLLVLDSSGSMSGNESYMKATISKNLKKGIDIAGFGSSWYNINKPDDYHINGSTALGKVLKAINDDKNANFNYIIISTDGHPDNVDLVREQAKILKDSGSKICSTYIAPINTPIPQILHDISSAVFLSDVENSVSKCQGEMQEQILGHTATQKTIDVNQFAF